MRRVRLTPEAEFVPGNQVDYLRTQGAARPARALLVRTQSFLTTTLAAYPGNGRFLADRNLWETWVPGTRLVVWYTFDEDELVVITFGIRRRIASVDDEPMRDGVSHQVARSIGLLPASARTT